MRGCLFTLLLGAVVVALVVVVGLPAVFAGVLTGAVTAAGLQADDTTVTVSSDPPTDLVGLRADRVRLTATDATFRGLRIGELDLVLRDVAVLDRTAERVDGTLAGVRLEVGGQPLELDEIAISGGDESLEAATTIDGADAEALIADAVEQRLGTRPAEVSLREPDRLVVDVGVPVEGSLDVTGDGDLVVRVDENPAGIEELVLLRGGQELPIRLTDVLVDGNGDLRLYGDLAIGIFG